HSQAMKFGKQQSCRLGRRPNWVPGMIVLPGKKHNVRLVEIQVVEQPKALIQRCTGRGYVGRKCRGQQSTETKCPREDCRRCPLREHVPFHFGRQYCASPEAAVQIT